MASENLKLLRQAYAAFSDGELERVLDRTDPEIEWGTTALFPGAEPLYLGHDGLVRWSEHIRSAWESFVVDADDVLLDEGEVVAVAEAVRGRGRGSGIEVGMPLFAIYEFRSGRLFRRRAFTSRDQLDEALASL